MQTVDLILILIKANLLSLFSLAEDGGYSKLVGGGYS